jgi:hypothetical protein
MKIAAAVLGAICLSAGAAEPQWVVAAPSDGAKVAPTFIVIPGRPVESWPLDYALANVGEPCGVGVDGDMRLVIGRKATAVRCEVKR